MTIWIRAVFGLCCCIVLLDAAGASAQDDRRDYPSLLSRGFVEIGVGAINYPFSETHVEPGHQVGRIEIPHPSARVAFGYRFDDYLSAQITYLRPIEWVRFENIDGTTNGGTVWMNVAAVTLKSRVPVRDALSVYGEAGLGVVTRHGIQLNSNDIIQDAVYAAPVLGGGGEYRLNREWGLTFGVLFTPSRSSPPQPKAVAFSGGFGYTINPARAIRPQELKEPQPIFPKHLVQAGLTTNALGYGFNTAVSPLFWQGDIDVRRGFTAHYQRNIFHTRSLFSLDWGTSFSYQTSRRNDDSFVALSIFPLFRFTVLRIDPADVYISYSLAGPTYISKAFLDGQRTGKKFTFQDLMGVGAYFGDERHWNVEFRVGHYSNGNLIPQNPGIKVPLTVNVGYAFSNGFSSLWGG